LCLHHPLIEGYAVEKRLGTGGQGKVFLGCGESRERCAIKIGATGTMKREVCALEKLEGLRVEGASVVRHLGSSLQVIPGGGRMKRDAILLEPLKELDESTYRKNPKETKDFLRNMAGLLVEMHNRGVVHLDLKEGNVLQNDNGDLVVVDFGACAFLDGELAKLHPLRGRDDIHPCVAQELTQRGKIGDLRKCDVFSLGMMAAMLFIGGGVGSSAQISMQMAGADLIFAKFVGEMCHDDPKKRPTMEEVLQRIKEM
jgi:serine/threonine protein kinase